MKFRLSCDISNYTNYDVFQNLERYYGNRKINMLEIASES